MRNKLIYLILGTLAIVAYIYRSGFDFENDLNGFYKGVLFGWIVAAWVIFLVRLAKN